MNLTKFTSLESLSFTKWGDLEDDMCSEQKYDFKSLKVLGVSDTSADNKQIRDSFGRNLIIIRA